MSPEFIQAINRSMASCRKRTSISNDTAKIAASHFTTQPSTRKACYKKLHFVSEVMNTSPESKEPSYRWEGQGLHRGPHRRNSGHDISPALGIGTPRSFKTIHWSEGKPIVRAPWPKDLTRRSDPRGACMTPALKEAASETRATVLQDAVRESAYQTVYVKAAEEYALPVPSFTAPRSTLEEHRADPVGLRVPRYTEPRHLQRAAFFPWDRYQPRSSPRAFQGEKSTTLPNITENQMIAQQSGKAAQEARRRGLESLCTANDTATVKACFIRPVPGYAGYLPRMPIPQKLLVIKRDGDDADDDDSDAADMMDILNGMSSTARASYRPLPSEMYKAPGCFTRKGLLSKTVSLTFPYNSFKKALQSQPNE